MRPLIPVMSALLLLHGCGAWEHASVSVTYGSASESEEWRLNAASRKRVEDAFEAFSQRHGYNCRPHIKRVEEIKCRGPKGLHLMFQPAMDKPQFVAGFTWVNSADRSHEEFMRHVSTFKTELAAVVGESNVRFEGQT